jgi:hypothetical protein
MQQIYKYYAHVLHLVMVILLPEKPFQCNLAHPHVLYGKHDG